MQTPQYGPQAQSGGPPQHGEPSQYGGPQYGEPYPGEQPHYPQYMHPVPPRQPSELGSFFTGNIVLLGVGLAALLIFIGAILRTSSDFNLAGQIVKLIGASGGFISAFGGAFLGREFNKQQRYGLYVVSAAFLLGMVLIF